MAPRLPEVTLYKDRVAARNDLVRFARRVWVLVSLETTLAGDYIFVTTTNANDEDVVVTYKSLEAAATAARHTNTLANEAVALGDIEDCAEVVPMDAWQYADGTVGMHIGAMIITDLDKYNRAVRGSA